jgi:hypothetical protein
MTTVETLDALHRRLTGDLARPGEDAYARLTAGFNAAVTATPAVVVEARDARDVAETVRFAAASGRAVAVQTTLARLTAIAAHHDPAHVFRTGQVPVRGRPASDHRIRDDQRGSTSSHR